MVRNYKKKEPKYSKEVLEKAIKEDIRSFFVVKNSNSAQKNLNLSSKKMGQKPGQKKRPIIIDSDSDEESTPVNTKRSKPTEEAKKIDYKKKPDVSETKSKYFECHNVSIKDIFDDTPVKRDTSRKIVKKVVSKDDKESHFDKNFEAELAQLDDTWLLAGGNIKEKNNEKCGFEEFPEKTKNMTADKSHKIGFEEFPEESKNINEDKYHKNTCKISPENNNSKQADKSNKKSPLKRNSSVEFDKSPRKKIKSEDKSDISETKDLKNEVNKSPDKKSPSKSSLFNKSPCKAGTSEKSPYKKLTLVREKKESAKCEKEEGFWEKSHKNNTNLYKNDILINPIINGESSKSKEDVKDLSENEKCVNRNDTCSGLVGDVKGSSCKGVSDTARCAKDSLVKNTSQKRDKNDLPPPVNSVMSSVPSNLWVERYKPTSIKQIIGQQGEKSSVNKLITWLKNWDKNHSGAKSVKPSWNKSEDGSVFKAALLSGPPGVGKTTSVHLVCKELGFDVVEFNASDTRSKKLLHEEVSELLSTNSLSPFFTGKGDQVTRKHVLVMDEVDGMAGNEDRGGVQELISLIKQSRIPIICMCNDRQHPKIRSLANYCFDLRFNKPRVEQIRGAMMSVCCKEKLKIKPDELSDIITSANQDMRLVMNHLSMLALEKTSLAKSTKHIKLGPWDVVRMIFSEQEHKSMSIHDKCDLFFHDYSLTPLFVQECYLSVMPHKPEAKNKIKRMELFAKAAKSLSLGDLTEKSIRSNNAWGLLPVQAIFSSLVPGEVLEGHIGAQINFPTWFGKNSRQTKMSRLVQELTVHSRLKISGNKEAMNLDYVSSLAHAIAGPLSRGANGVPDALSVLSEYCLVREDVESITELCTWPGRDNQFSKIDSKVKAAFTRAYNKTSAPTPYAAVPIKKGRGDIDATDETGEEEETVSRNVEEDEEEGLEADAMIMVKKKPAGKRNDKDTQPTTSKGSKISKRGRKK